MKQYYTNYVSHCLRYYARHPEPVFKTQAERKDWEACDRALKKWNDKTREWLTLVYKAPRDAAGNYRYENSMNDCVVTVSEITGISTDAIWKELKALEREVAVERGLL